MKNRNERIWGGKDFLSSSSFILHPSDAASAVRCGFAGGQASLTLGCYTYGPPLFANQVARAVSAGARQHNSIRRTQVGGDGERPERASCASEAGARAKYADLRVSYPLYTRRGRIWARKSGAACVF